MDSANGLLCNFLFRQKNSIAYFSLLQFINKRSCLPQRLGRQGTWNSLTMKTFHSN